MKNTLLLALLIMTNYASAQQLSDYYDAASANRPEFSYNVTVRIQKNEGATSDAKRYTATLVQASPDSKGYYNASYDRKFYSCNQLGNVCNPNGFSRILVTLYYRCNGQQKVTNVSFSKLNEQQFVSVVLGAGGSFCESIDFDSIEVNGANLSPSHREQIRVKIDQSNSGGNNSSSDKSNNSNNPLSSDSPTNASNNPLAPANKNYELKNSDIGLPDDNNNGTNTNPMVTGANVADSYNKGQQVVDIANGVADLFAPTPGQLQRRAEKEAVQERGRQAQLDYYADLEKTKKDRFIKDFLPLMTIAEKAKGKLNVATNTMEYSKEVCNARMALYYASYHLNALSYVPKREEWFESAVANNNFDALLEKASQINTTSESNEGFPYVKKAADLGSADAMMRLAIYYDLNYSFDQGNPKLALEWFTKAAEKGSPNAMYHLGMIYKYGYATDGKKYHAKYDVVKDEAKAFEWFSKSIQPNYKESFFARSDYFQGFRASYYLKYSFFEKESYKELAAIYRQGKVVAKNREKAKELEKSYEDNHSRYSEVF